MMLVAMLILLYNRQVHTATLNLMRKLVLHQLPHEVAFSRDGQSLAVAGDSGYVFYTTKDWICRRTMHWGGFSVSAVDGNSKFAVVGWNNGVYSIYVVGVRSTPNRVALPALRDEGVDIAVSLDGMTLGVTTPHKILMYSLSTRKVIWKKDLGTVFCKDMFGLPSGFAMIISGRDSDLVDIDSAPASIPPNMRVFPKMRVHILAYSPARRILTIGMDDGRLFTLDPTGRHLRFLCCPLHQIPRCLSVSPDGSLLAVGYRRDFKTRRGKNLLLLISSATGRILAKDAHSDGVQGLDFAPDGRTLAQTDRGGYMRLFQCIR